MMYILLGVFLLFFGILMIASGRKRQSNQVAKPLSVAEQLASQRTAAEAKKKADELLNEAIALIKAGKKLEAQRLLEPFIEANPQNITAWMWEAETNSTLAGRISVAEDCLRHNPDNPQVKLALGKLWELQAPEANSALGASAAAALPEVKAEASPKLKPCPYCAEMIQQAAIVCRFCGRDLQKPLPTSQPESLNTSQTPAAVEAPKTKQASDGANGLAGLSIVAGVVGIFVFALPLGVFAIICGIVASAVGATAGLLGILLGIVDLVVWFAIVSHPL